MPAARTPAGARPDPVEPVLLDRRRVWLVMSGLMLGLLIAALDQTIVATALPTIASDLHGLSHLSWVVTAYLLASTASTPLWGKLGDLYGRKSFFQGAIVIFLIGSALSGLSTSMVELIGFRALQGLGGGGLIVGAQAIVGDVVPPKDRGRYQGLFGAVFGVASVIGPLVGGFFVDNLSWRWVFYVNLPIGAVALLVTAAVLPSVGQRVHRVIDYLGTALVASGATALILLTSLGGVSYGWSSPPILFLGVLGVILLVGFVLAERRAVEPIIPLRLFANKVFSATSAIGFVVGFAMFGAITYLPTFLQIVKGVSPTISGVKLLPLMFGLLITSIGSGVLISRWGRYKFFPISGTAFMGLGLYLMSLLGTRTSTLVVSVDMFILGMGLGGVMQVLVIAVQNAVDYTDLGTATSGATFFRSMGGSFGVAIFGAIFTNRLDANLRHVARVVHLPVSVAKAASADPAVLLRLPAAIHAAFLSGYAAALRDVFAIAVPIAAAAFLLTFFLPEMRLRRTAQAVDLGETFAMPETRTSLDELERAVSVLSAREDLAALYRRLADASGCDLDPLPCWLLYRMDGRPPTELARLARAVRAPVDRLASVAEVLVRRGLATLDSAGEPSGESSAESLGPAARPSHRDGQAVLRLTPAGQDVLARLVVARHHELARYLDGWSLDDHPELTSLVGRLAHSLHADDPGDRLFAASAAATGRSTEGQVPVAPKPPGS